MVHVIAEFSGHEAMGGPSPKRPSGAGRALRSPRRPDGTDVFAGVTELGGAVETFRWVDAKRLDSALRAWRPTSCTCTAVRLAPLFAGRTGISLANLMTMYVWPTLPPPRRLRSGGLIRPHCSRTCCALAWRRPRWCHRPLSAGRCVGPGTHTVLTPDPRTLDRFQQAWTFVGWPGAPVWIRGGATFQQRAGGSLRRPRGNPCAGSTRRSTVSPLVLKAVPDARLRLLLIPRPELDGLLAAHMPPDWRPPRCGDRAELGSARGERRRRPEPALQIRLHDLAVNDGRYKASAWPPPTVATDVSCLRAVVEDGVNGMVVPPLAPRRSQRRGELLRHEAPEALRRCGSDHGDASVRMGSDGGHNIGCSMTRAEIGVAQVAGRTLRPGWSGPC